MSELRRNAIIQIMTDCRKITLQNYASSLGLSKSGTKLQLAMRIFDGTNRHTYNIHMPPHGTLSIGIALEKVNE